MRIMKRSKQSKIFTEYYTKKKKPKMNTRLLPDFFPFLSLEIQMDENEALKAALQSTLKAKEEDLRLFGEMMEETKTVFLQALRQYKQNAQGT